MLFASGETLERGGTQIHTAKSTHREREYATLYFIDALNACCEVPTAALWLHYRSATANDGGGGRRTFPSTRSASR